MRIACSLGMAVLLGIGMNSTAVRAQAPPPNILWITCEDTSPNLGAYGDKYATTPNLDRFAQQALRYTAAWSNCPVCAPARTALITGMYPWSIGASHMRCMVKMPKDAKLLPQLMREAGYYCTNNSKEDYNVEPSGQVWDESSGGAHWRNRGGKPFFAVFNIMETHESNIRVRPHTPVHDPARAPLPPFHPDTPEVRLDWAQVYDNITNMDRTVGQRLAELDASGLADNTIVFFFGDHGSGMPGFKRVSRNTGLQVPLIVRVPARLKNLAPSDYAAGAASNRPVSFVDFAPSVLSLAGVKPPASMHGLAFLGAHPAESPGHVFGGRGRMDERHDLARAVRDGRYVYVRNFAPLLPWGQRVDFMFKTKTTQLWRKMFREDKLSPEQAAFWQPRAAEELYDLQSDPFELKNLAESAEHRDTIESFRKILHQHQLTVRDIDLLPEPEMLARSMESSPFDVGSKDETFPIAAVLETAEKATSLKPEFDADLVAALAHDDAGVRYWGTRGLLLRGAKTVESNQRTLFKMLEDNSPSVRIVVGEALCRFGKEGSLVQGRKTMLKYCLLETNDWPIAVFALNALDNAGPNVEPALSTVLLAPKTTKKISTRYSSYVPRIVESIDNKLNPKPRLKIPPIAN